MKKFLTLCLVLALASAANAAIVLSINGSTDVDEITIAPSDWVTVDIYNDNMETLKDFNLHAAIYNKSEGLYALANARLGPAAGDMPATFSGPYQGYGVDADWYYMSQSWSITGTPIPGVIFLFDLHCEDLGTVLVELFDYRESETVAVDSLSIYQPEPMTIALLGLGGLFLRRRK